MLIKSPYFASCVFCMHLVFSACFSLSFVVCFFWRYFGRLLWLKMMGRKKHQQRRADSLLWWLWEKGPLEYNAGQLMIMDGLHIPKNPQEEHLHLLTTLWRGTCGWRRRRSFLRLIKCQAQVEFLLCPQINNQTGHGRETLDKQSFWYRKIRQDEYIEAFK